MRRGERFPSRLVLAVALLLGWPRIGAASAGGPRLSRTSSNPHLQIIFTYWDYASRRYPLCPLHGAGNQRHVRGTPKRRGGGLRADGQAAAEVVQAPRRLDQMAPGGQRSRARRRLAGSGMTFSVATVSALGCCRGAHGVKDARQGEASRPRLRSQPLGARPGCACEKPRWPPARTAPSPGTLLAPDGEFRLVPGGMGWSGTRFHHHNGSTSSNQQHRQ